MLYQLSYTRNSLPAWLRREPAPTTELKAHQAGRRHLPRIISSCIRQASRSGTAERRLEGREIHGIDIGIAVKVEHVPA